MPEKYSIHEKIEEGHVMLCPLCESIAKDLGDWAFKCTNKKCKYEWVGSTRISDKVSHKFWAGKVFDMDYKEFRDKKHGEGVTDETEIKGEYNLINEHFLKKQLEKRTTYCRLHNTKCIDKFMPCDTCEVRLAWIKEIRNSGFSLQELKRIYKELSR